MEEVLKSILHSIENEMERVYWNKYQKEYNSPFSNTGEIYSNDVFTVRAYNWEDNSEPNFECEGIKCWWYKHINRGFDYSCNITDVFELERILINCLESIQF